MSAISIGAATGFVTAAAVDFAAFRSWKSWNEFVSFDWRIAMFRWLVGIVTGAVAGAGLGQL